MTDDERAARQDIADVIIRYASGIDRRDWDLFRTCFTPDCEADYGDAGTFAGVEALTEFMIASHAEMGHTLHRINNIAISVSDDIATARSYVDAVLLAPDGATGVNPIGYYDDELVRTDDGWRIARRTVTIATYQVIG
jgi:3-phenylpropionate/cinnamic acid dioxygenase small subunit